MQSDFAEPDQFFSQGLNPRIGFTQFLTSSKQEAEYVTSDKNFGTKHLQAGSGGEMNYCVRPPSFVRHIQCSYCWTGCGCLYRQDIPALVSPHLCLVAPEKGRGYARENLWVQPLQQLRILVAVLVQLTLELVLPGLRLLKLGAETIFFGVEMAR